jgi:sialic acid synthase SpsE
MVYRSVPPNWWWNPPSSPEEEPYMEEWLCCVSKYPAEIEDYDYKPSHSMRPQDIKDHILNCHGLHAMSDHTVGLDLLRKWKHTVRGMIWEKHFVLKHDDANPDAGPFAITPSELKEALEL